MDYRSTETSANAFRLTDLATHGAGGLPLAALTMATPEAHG